VAHRKSKNIIDLDTVRCCLSKKCHWT